MTSHASRRTAHPGRSSSFYITSSDKIEYHKQPLTLDQQVQKLKERGLVFSDESKAKAYLFNISYYRLRAYTYPFQDNSEGSDHCFLQSNPLFKDFIGTLPNFRGKAKRMSNKTEMITVI